MNKIHAVNKLGQKFWLDNLSREFLVSGGLQQMLDQGISGITSNPSIFLNAIAHQTIYQKELSALKKTKLSPIKRYEQLAIEDIKQYCQAFLPIYEKSQKTDGFVSLEVSPDLANKTWQTVASALELYKAVGYPNLMIKIPGNAAGIDAFEQLIILGINVNITLLFSLEQVQNVWAAYIRGLNQRAQHFLAIDDIHAVASFFLSRIDSAIDPLLPKKLQGKTAINLARAAYLKYRETFNSKEFIKLQKLGAKPQQLLWASTGTKNNAYSDVLYVEELIGHETINTIPDKTLAAFLDHGQVTENLIKDLDNAPNILQQIQHQGINLSELGENLQQDGLKIFSKSFDELIELFK